MTTRASSTIFLILKIGLTQLTYAFLFPVSKKYFGAHFGVRILGSIHSLPSNVTRITVHLRNIYIFSPGNTALLMLRYVSLCRATIIGESFATMRV